MTVSVTVGDYAELGNGGRAASEEAERMSGGEVAVESGAAWQAAMRRGDFAAAWHVCDRVLRERVAAGPCWDLPRHEQWVWDGRPLTGRRVLVRCYHGLGDTLQFARFLPSLAKLASSVVVWAPSALIPLLRRLQCELELLPLHDGTPEVDYDVDAEIMELGHALRVDVEDLAQAVPYFDVPAARKRSGIGVVARSGDWDGERSVPEALLAELPRAVNLQLAPPIEGIPDWSTPDIAQLAERVQALDLVISADTMVAHLAGALGVPVWTLLKHDADWRWMDDRTDSPWYPTMRLFRQPRPGDWVSVMAAVRDAL